MEEEEDDLDSSLARGYKNQFLREVKGGLDQVIKDFTNYILGIKPQLQNRNKWEYHVSKCVEKLGPYLLDHQVFGGKRHPTLCLYVFEDVQRTVNTWDEECLSTCVMSLSAKPFNSVARPVGFNISEHAIKRIFERKIAYNSQLDYRDKLQCVTEELAHAPLLSVFWSMISMGMKARGIQGPLEIKIPSPSGMLLGSIDSKSYVCEIRTFVASDQLFENQIKLRSEMIKICDRFDVTGIPYYWLSLCKDVQIKPELVDEFWLGCKPILHDSGFTDLFET